MDLTALDLFEAETALQESVQRLSRSNVLADRRRAVPLSKLAKRLHDAAVAASQGGGRAA